MFQTIRRAQANVVSSDASRTPTSSITSTNGTSLQSIPSTVNTSSSTHAMMSQLAPKQTNGTSLHQSTTTITTSTSLTTSSSSTTESTTIVSTKRKPTLNSSSISTASLSLPKRAKNNEFEKNAHPKKSYPLKFITDMEPMPLIVELTGKKSISLPVYVADKERIVSTHDLFYRYISSLPVKDDLEKCEQAIKWRRSKSALICEAVLGLPSSVFVFAQFTSDMKDKLGISKNSQSKYLVLDKLKNLLPIQPPPSTNLMDPLQIYFLIAGLINALNPTKPPLPTSISQITQVSCSSSPIPPVSTLMLLPASPLSPFLSIQRRAQALHLRPTSITKTFALTSTQEEVDDEVAIEPAVDPGTPDAAPALFSIASLLSMNNIFLDFNPPTPNDDLLEISTFINKHGL